MALVGLILLIFSLVACNASSVVQFSDLQLDIPPDALKAPVVRPLPDNQKLHVGVTLKMNQDWLKKMEGTKIEPGKPSHLEDFAKKIGIDDQTYQKFKDFFSPQGIALKLNKLHTYLTFDAKASTLAKLLQTRFVVRKYNGREFYGPETAPKVPAFMTSSIVSVTGLDNYSSKPVHALQGFTQQPGSKQQATGPRQLLTSGQTLTTQQTNTPQQDCSPPDQTLFPRDVAGAYGFDRLWNKGWNGQNMTVNLVEIDGSYRDDIQNYFDCIQFKGHLSVVNVDSAPRDALGESTLDVQMAAGLARSVNIKLYQTDGNADDNIWGRVNDMLQRILDDNTNGANSGSVVSISLGAPENEISQDDVRALDSTLQQLTRVEHMSVFVASGDCGAFGSRQYGRLAVSYPGSDPWITSVGGTILQVDQNRQRNQEVAWSDNSGNSCKNQWGSGGGNSILFKQPSWQNAPGVRNQYSRGMRQVPDVSAAAYGLAVYFNGQWGAVGGTSAAAPIWATGMALVNQGKMQQRHSFSYGPQAFYQADKGQSYYDITQGDNLYYRAARGWDFPTGLGSPNLDAFYNAAP